MKRITSLIVPSLVTILIGSGGLATNLQAQSDLPITASIPFPFTVGTQSIAPGTYRFSLVSGQFLLSMINVKTGHEEIFAVRPELQRALEPHGRVTFRDFEGHSALNEVHFPGTDSFSEVVQRHGGGRVVAKASSTSRSMSVGQN